MKFDKERTWGWIVPGTSAGCLSSSPAEKRVAVTVDTKLSMSQQGVFILNKVNHRLSYIRKGAWTADE